MDDNGAILAGIRVLDVASYIAAPVSTTIMADFGAEVIKVEPPAGDPYRHLVDAPGVSGAEVDFQWQVTNRNKRGIVLDLTTAAGRQVMHRLVARSDVFVTNFTRPARARLGLSYDHLRPLNDRLIYASMTAYGEDGAEAERSGFDTTAYWARTGLMHQVRPAPDVAPARSLPGMGDHPSGVALFGAIMLALLERQRTGRGRKVHSSLLANGLWANAFCVQAALSGATVALRPPREDWPNALTNHYRCGDGHWFILVAIDEDRHWSRLIDAVGRPDLAEDARFATPAARRANARALIGELDAVFAARDWAHWRDALAAHRLAFGNVGTPDEACSDAQMVAAGALAEVVDSRIGAPRIVDSPLWIDGAGKRAPDPAPRHGEHTAQVLQEAGYSTAEIVQLRNDGAIPGQLPDSSD